MALVSCLALAACGTDVVHLQSATATNPRPECVSVPTSNILCVYCGPTYAQQRACLKCGAVDPTTACAPCIWSDLADGGACQQCANADGTMSPIGCTGRADLQVPAGTL